MGDTRSHNTIFPGVYIKRWRWSFDRVFWSYYGPFDIDDSDKIRNHMSKKYGIKWYDNGYHDIDYMSKIIE